MGVNVFIFYRTIIHITVFCRRPLLPCHRSSRSNSHIHTHTHLSTVGQENDITEKINNGKFKSAHMIIVSSGAHARLAVPLNKF